MSKCFCSSGEGGGAGVSSPSRSNSLSISIAIDRKSTRLNSSHSQISYAVFCLKKKNDALPHLGADIEPAASVRVLLGLTAAVHHLPAEASWRPIGVDQAPIVLLPSGLSDSDSH